MIQTSNRIGRRMLERTFAVLYIILVTVMSYGATAETKDKELLDGFIKAKGYKACILLTPSNIKQFWTEKSVSSQNDLIKVILEKTNANQRESSLYKIQLANVLETQDCKIEMITESSDLSFSVYNSDNKVISSSSKEDDFIQYHVVSSTFHLGDTNDFAFYCSFSSNNDIVALKRIIISFSDNPNSVFAGSPGFDKLLEKIDAEGKDIPDSNVKYLISKEHHKIFIRIPQEISLDSWVAYHVHPVDEKDVAQGREKHGFNNFDFIPLEKAGTIIPKPYSSATNYSIIQVQLPLYQYKSLILSQSKDGKKLWRIEFSSKTLQEN